MSARTARRRAPRRPMTVAGRKRLVAGGVIAGAALLGYLATMLIFPAPLVSRETPVARVIGLPEEEAQQMIEAQGFRPRVEQRGPDPVIPAGHVLWQDPPPGVELTANSLVQLTVSEGPATSVVPDVSEFVAEQATRILRAGGFRIGAVDSVAGAQPAGVVLSTRPAVGTSRPAGSTVDLVVSRGPANIRVPSVVGMDRLQARQVLETAGLRVGGIETRSARGQPAGRILEQRPAAGTLSPREGRVTLVIVRPEGP